MSPMSEHSQRPETPPPGSWSEEPDEPADREPAESEPVGRSHAAARLLGALIGLVLTPIALGLLTYGGFRYQELAAAGGDFEHDTRGLVALIAGALVLLIVAWAGALSAAGPMLGGLVWGLLPALLFLVYPEDTLSRVDDIPVVPADTEAGTITWLAVGSFLAVGVVLFGSALSVALRRR